MLIPPLVVIFVLIHDELASKFMIDVGAGVIDADYRGIVYVLLFNLSAQDFKGKGTLLFETVAQTDTKLTVEEGDRVAQLIIERIYTPETLEVQVGLIKSQLESYIEVVYRISTRPCEVLVASVLLVAMAP